MKTSLRKSRSRRAFSLLEVLVATAVFGIAAAGLFLAVTPVYDRLFSLSNNSADAGDLEIVKSMVEATTSYSAVSSGGTAALPDGRKLSWNVRLEPTNTEAVFLVRLTAETDGESLFSEYLHFEPRWQQIGTERPRWLTHAAGSPGGGGGGGRGGNGNNGGRGPGQGQGRGQGQGQGEGRGQGQGQGRGQGGNGGGRPGGGGFQGGGAGGGARR